MSSILEIKYLCTHKRFVPNYSNWMMLDLTPKGEKVH